MIFKVIGGVGPDTIDELWISSDTKAENVNAALDTTSSYRAHYKNRVVHVQNWQTFMPQEVIKSYNIAEGTIILTIKIKI